MPTRPQNRPTKARPARHAQTSTKLGLPTRPQSGRPVPPAHWAARRAVAAGGRFHYAAGSLNRWIGGPCEPDCAPAGESSGGGAGPLPRWLAGQPIAADVLRRAARLSERLEGRRHMMGRQGFMLDACDKKPAGRNGVPSLNTAVIYGWQNKFPGVQATWQSLAALRKVGRHSPRSSSATQTCH